MAGNGLAERVRHSVAGAHAARLAAAGSACHPYVEELGEPGTLPAARDLDDLVHLLCSLHGRPPGLIELALALSPGGDVTEWLSVAAYAFERERLYLVRLTAAVGPLPSTPGNAETEAALVAQRHALETLAQSERVGCALGACSALVSDWRAVRPLLDRSAVRVGIEPPTVTLPDEASVAAVLEVCGAFGPAAERAIRFGAEQLLLQHRALFDLLEARSDARQGF